MKPTWRGLLRLIENQSLESDYAIAIVGASLIERALEVAILSRFVPMSKTDRGRLFEFEQPLGSFSARIRIGAALGLYDPLRVLICKQSSTYEISSHIRRRFESLAMIQ